MQPKKAKSIKPLSKLKINLLCYAGLFSVGFMCEEKKIYKTLSTNLPAYKKINQPPLTGLNSENKEKPRTITTQVTAHNQVNRTLIHPDNSIYQKDIKELYNTDNEKEIFNYSNKDNLILSNTDKIVLAQKKTTLRDSVSKNDIDIDIDAQTSVLEQSCNPIDQKKGIDRKKKTIKLDISKNIDEKHDIPKGNLQIDDSSLKNIDNKNEKVEIDPPLQQQNLLKSSVLKQEKQLKNLKNLPIIITDLQDKIEQHIKATADEQQKKELKLLNSEAEKLKQEAITLLNSINSTEKSFQINKNDYEQIKLYKKQFQDILDRGKALIQ